MKRFVGCGVIMLCLAGASASAWDAGYLLIYPTPIEEGNWMIGLGLGMPGYNGYSSIFIPPIVLWVDYAFPIGGLPFTVGGIWGISGSSQENDWRERTWIHLQFGGRIAYHFNWGVDKLDTYITTTLGVGVAVYDKTYFLLGTHIGAKYYFIPNSGVFAELGGFYPYIAALGVTFNF